MGLYLILSNKGDILKGSICCSVDNNSKEEIGSLNIKISYHFNRKDFKENYERGRSKRPYIFLRPGKKCCGKRSVFRSERIVYNNHRT